MIEDLHSPAYRAAGRALDEASRRLAGVRVSLNALTMQMSQVSDQLDRATREMGYAIPLLQRPEDDFDVIVKTIAEHFHIHPASLIGKVRTDLFTGPRFYLYLFAREFLSLPYAAIGGLIGGRDHQSIAYGMKRIMERIQGDSSVRAESESLRADLKRQLEKHRANGKHHDGHPAN